VRPFSYRRSGRDLLFSALLIAACAVSATPLAAQTWGPLALLERSIPPGGKLKFSYMSTPTFEGAFLDTVVFAARGIRPGPTLCLTALVHGDERNGFEIARTAFARVDARELAGWSRSRRSTPTAFAPAAATCPTDAT
jgi:hypothetical protein